MRILGNINLKEGPLPQPPAPYHPGHWDKQLSSRLHPPLPQFLEATVLLCWGSLMRRRAGLGFFILIFRLGLLFSPEDRCFSPESSLCPWTRAASCQQNGTPPGALEGCRMSARFSARTQGGREGSEMIPSQGVSQGSNCPLYPLPASLHKPRDLHIQPHLGRYAKCPCILHIPCTSSRACVLFLCHIDKCVI